MKKTVVSITGIRPDFIRMKTVFKLLDKNFNHILVHTGQHYSSMLSDVFFKELKIRKPDYNLSIGSKKNEHFHQLSNLSVRIIELIRKEKINPSCIIFLGDSNSVAASIALKKEGYKIAHIEAGMRSHDKRMLEEINRIVCDHCSELNFVYHKDYKKNLLNENITSKNIFIVGNTIKDIAKEFVPSITKKNKQNNFILADIHRPENFKYKERLKKIFILLNKYSRHFNMPVYLINFSRTIAMAKKFNLKYGKIQIIDLMSYKHFLNKQYHSFFLVSDSGTAQEEASLFKTPVITPRDFTERPQSMEYNCSYLFKINNFNNSYKSSIIYLNNIKSLRIKINSNWLGDGKTALKIIKILKNRI